MPVQKKIDLSTWQQSYTEGTGRAGDKLVRKFDSRTGIVDALTTPAAISNFTTNVTSPLAVAVRTAKLKAQGDAGLHAGMDKKGKANYTKATADNAAKALKNFTPYAPVLEGAVNALVARTMDSDTNIDNRVKPIGRALQKAKKALYGVP